MSIPIEQLLNIPGIRVLSVDYDEKKIECVGSNQPEGFSICHKCGQKATIMNTKESCNCGICRCVAGK